MCLIDIPTDDSCSSFGCFKQASQKLSLTYPLKAIATGHRSMLISLYTSDTVRSLLILLLEPNVIWARWSGI